MEKLPTNRRLQNGKGHYGVLARDVFGSRLPQAEGETGLTRTKAGILARLRSETHCSPVVVTGRLGYPAEQWEKGHYVHGVRRKIGAILDWLTGE